MADTPNESSPAHQPVDEPVHQVDARNTFCPIPIIRLAAKIRTVEVGETVRVLATDEGLVPDIKAWCKGTRHELLSLTENDAGVLVADVRKTR